MSGMLAFPPDARRKQRVSVDSRTAVYADGALLSVWWRAYMREGL